MDTVKQFVENLISYCKNDLHMKDPYNVIVIILCIMLILYITNERFSKMLHSFFTKKMVLFACILLILVINIKIKPKVALIISLCIITMIVISMHVKNTTNKLEELYCEYNMKDVPSYGDTSINIGKGATEILDNINIFSDPITGVSEEEMKSLYLHSNEFGEGEVQ